MGTPDSDRGCMTHAALGAVNEVMAAIQNVIEAECELVAGDNTIISGHVVEAVRCLFHGRVLSAAMNALNQEAKQ